MVLGPEFAAIHHLAQCDGGQVLHTRKHHGSAAARPSREQLQRASRQQQADGSEQRRCPLWAGAGQGLQFLGSPTLSKAALFINAVPIGGIVTCCKLYVWEGWHWTSINRRLEQWFMITCYMCMSLGFSQTDSESQ